MRKLEDILSRFPSNKLRRILGDTLVELLTEWALDREIIYDSNVLAKFCVKIKSTELTKNKKFLSDLISYLTEDELDDLLRLMNQSATDQIDKYSKLDDLIKSNKNKGLFLDYLGMQNHNEDTTCLTKNIASISSCTNNSQFYELFDYQEIIKQQTLNLINDETNLRRVLIQMPTGTGKTKTAVHTIINHYIFKLKKNGLILWIAPGEELLNQALETFENCWSHIGSGEIRIYRMWGKYNPLKEIDDLDHLNGIMFVGVLKLVNLLKKSPDIFECLVKSSRIIVFDEAHKAAADESFKAVSKLMIKKDGYPDRSLIGLTATPGRTTSYSEENNKLVDMFEGKKITIDSKLLNMINYGDINAINMDTEKNIIKYLQNRGVLSKMKLERLNYIENLTPDEIRRFREVLVKKTGKDYTEEQVKYLATNTSRNLQILKRLRELNDANISTIVFAANVEHAKTLNALLKMENIDSSLVLSQTPTDERQQVISDFKAGKNNIIINYGALTTGFDAKNIQCVFITRPTKSVVLYSQMLGRGLRGPLMGGNEDCLVIDVKDNLESFDNEEAFEHFADYWD